MGRREQWGGLWWTKSACTLFLYHLLHLPEGELHEGKHFLSFYLLVYLCTRTVPVLQEPLDHHSSSQYMYIYIPVYSQARNRTYNCIHYTGTVKPSRSLGTPQEGFSLCHNHCTA